MKTRLTFCFLLVAAVALFAQTFNSIYIPNPYKLIFGRGVAGDVSLSKTADNVLAVESGNTLNVVSADKLTVNSVIVPQTVIAQHISQTGDAATARVFFFADTTYQVTACSEVHSVAAGGVSTLTLTKETTTGAPGAGNNVLTGSFDLNGTANTVQNGTLTATGADLQLIAGDRLSIKYANTIQSTAGLRVVCTLKRI